MGLLRQLGNALFLRRGLRCGLFLIRREVFAHFLLMLAKRKSTYALGLYFESLNVSCLISNTHVSSPRLRLLFLILRTLALTLKTARSYSSKASRAGLAQLVERAIRNRKVIGSTPIAGSNLHS
jgi:hypothetical protein